jgi:hypothetical protein
MNYYKNYFLRYISANEATREASRQHWLKCHAENVLSGREDLIIFSAQILASISLADDMLKKLNA